MDFKNIDNNKLQSGTSSLNSLSPYIGRLRPECAQFLIDMYADPNLPIFDPFCGSGTILLQGWINGFDVYGIDLSPYAELLSNGKLNPIRTLELAQERLNSYSNRVIKKANHLSLDTVPDWVREFYHDDTLKEIISWTYYLKKNHEYFLLSCLMGILHHQRPGFLSYPASHGAPYLRTAKYPQSEFPEMYTYRNVKEKLEKKLIRVYKNFPELQYDHIRAVHCKDASRMRMSHIPRSTIITSPPYMRSLTYARDNRLRLWFLGESDWDSLDDRISPRASDFTSMMTRCLNRWSSIQAPGDKCVVVIGDLNLPSKEGISLAQFIENISKPYYNLIEAYQDPIPEAHKQVKGTTKIKREIIVSLERR